MIVTVKKKLKTHQIEFDPLNFLPRRRYKNRAGLVAPLGVISAYYETAMCAELAAAAELALKFAFPLLLRGPGEHHVLGERVE